jgi:predicted aminopeptidase
VRSRPAGAAVAGLTALLAGVVLLVAGCASPSYYLQAIGGQIELWREARPVEEVAAGSESAPELRRKLEQAQAIRDYASRELGLPANGSYRKYADLGRPYVVWNVFAAPRLSIEPKQWCFLVAGCVSYRGYFDKAEAEALAAQLRGEGYDVHVGGVPAYSTLGWFDDPLLNTFINYPDPELARLIFHELAHQVAYAGDDTEFNESFATVVELTGVERWLGAEGSAEQRAQFRQAQARRQDFLGLVLATRTRLASLYASQIPPPQMEQEKARILAGLGEDYRRLKAEKWSGYAGYDRWFGQEINNATLASIGIYTSLVPAFEALLAQEHGDLPRFYGQVKRLAGMPKEERHERLSGLATIADAAGAAAR